MPLLEITPLCEKSEFAPLLARWTYDEWYQDRSIEFEFILGAFRLRTRDESLPLSFICFYDAVPAGMVTLKLDDLWSRKDLNPWLSSLYVVPEYRNRGVGHKLIDAVIETARKRGCPRLYLFIGSRRREWLEQYYLRRGWEIVDMATDNDGLETKILCRAVQ